MKKTTLKWVLGCICIMALVGIIGAIKLYNDFFPMAQPIQLPHIEKISAIEISKNDFDIKYIDHETIKAITDQFSKVKETRILSVHDAPTVSEYYTINIIAEDKNRIYTLFIYKENAKWYIEQPYWGVYEIDENILSFIEEGS